MRCSKKAFTLIEILIAITIFSLIIIFAFQTLGSLSIGKVRIIQKNNLEKQAFFSAEKIFDLIKRSGTIDYEEYWNRFSYNTTTLSGSFALSTGFGNYGRNGSLGVNYGSGRYICFSPNGGSMGTGGCLLSNNSHSATQSGIYQRYGQYELQFIDYNADGDSNSGNPGDEDGDGNKIGDDDDLYLGFGPYAFRGSIDPSQSHRVPELYLINTRNAERTFLRWNVIRDPYAPAGANCTGTGIMTGSGCLGRIEFLKLQGFDYGVDHSGATLDTNGTQGDGLIDTWLLHPDFSPTATPTFPESTTTFWQPILSSDVHVKNFELFVYPRKDYTLSWKDNMDIQGITPYIQLRLTLEPSWSKKRILQGNIPEFHFQTTIDLLDTSF